MEVFLFLSTNFQWKGLFHLNYQRNDGFFVQIESAPGLLKNSCYHFSFECRKTQTKDIILANHNGRKHGLRSYGFLSENTAESEVRTSPLPKGSCSPPALPWKGNHCNKG